ncbi:hypothetical protein [Streptomyces sp. NRRL F-5135]|uniref:hypothetical protein n=1 Tax=Streptomyces sp. NRRL F-5135 TaxID=1463858 RepID=UPI00131C5144|nr:hypothetical protein [Streptomyces sp. NRRL F-5135]
MQIDLDRGVRGPIPPPNDSIANETDISTGNFLPVIATGKKLPIFTPTQKWPHFGCPYFPAAT